MGRGLPDGPWKGPTEPPDSGGRRLSRPLPRGVKPGLFFRTATPLGGTGPKASGAAPGGRMGAPISCEPAAAWPSSLIGANRRIGPSVSKEPTAAQGQRSHRPRAPHRSSQPITPTARVHQAFLRPSRPSLPSVSQLVHQRPILPRGITQSRNKVPSQHQQSSALPERAAGTPSA
jgi:hypothetical protein